MIEALKSIKWDKIGKFGGNSLIVCLLVYITDRFLGIGIIPNLTQINAVLLLILIFTSLFLVAVLATFTKGKMGYIALIFLLIIFLRITKLFENSPKPKPFQVWVKEYKTAMPIDSVRFEVPNGEQGFSQDGLIQFEYVGSADTFFQMKLSKKGYITEYKKANNKDQFTLKPER